MLTAQALTVCLSPESCVAALGCSMLLLALLIASSSWTSQLPKDRDRTPMKPSSGVDRGRKGSTNRRAYPGGGPLSPELGPLSFDALRSSGPSSGSSSEVERVDVEAPKATQEADGDGDGWVYRTERRLWESPPLSNLLSQPESSSPGASPHADLSSFADLGAFLPETGIERKREEDGLGCRRRQKPFGSASAPRKRSFGGRWQSSPRPLPVFPTTWKVEVVAAGLTHSLLLLDDGRVCVFGDNAFGQCAQPPSVARVKSALVLTNLPPCTAISAGQNTNMAVSQPPQKVFVWGGSPVAGPRVSSAPSAAVSHAVAPSSSSSGASSAPTCAACGRNAQAALPFFSPMRLKGVGRREEEPAVTNDGWTMKTTPQGCPLFSTDTLAINDSAGLAVGADERLYIFHCGVRPPIVSRAVPLLFSSDVSAPLSSPHPGPPASPSRGAPALPVLPSAPNAPASTPPSYLHLPQPRTASSPPGGVRQLSLSSSQIFLLTADGLLYSAPIPDASTFTSRPTGKEDEPSRPRGCSSFPPADPKQETLGKRRTPSVSSASSSWSFPSSSSLSPFVLSPSIPEPAELPSGQALCLPPSARPGSSSQQTPGSSRGLPSGFSARQSPACSPADMGCMQASHVEGDGDHATRALGSRRRDRPDTAPGLPGDGSLTSPAPSSVCLHFSPVRQAGSIGAFACSETHTAVIVEIHSPQFRPYTRPPLRSSRGVRQICAAIRASSREVRRRAKHDNVAPVPAFSSDDSLPSSSLSSPRYPAVSPHLPPSLASCAAQALLRPKRPFPATVGHVLETVVPLAVSLGDKSLFDYCCLFLLFNLPLLFLAFHHAKMPSPVSGCTAGPLRSLDIPSLFQTLGSAKRPRPFGSESSSSAASSASCGNGDAFVLAVAGMQYLLRSYKAAVTTAYLRSGTNRNLPLNQQTCLDTLNTLWAHDHDVPGRYTQTRRGNQGSPSVFSSLDEWSPRGTAREAGLDSDDDWAEPRHFHPSGTRRAALRSGPHEETTTSRIFSGMRVLPQPQRQRGQLDEQLPNSLGGLPWPNDIPALLCCCVFCGTRFFRRCGGASLRVAGMRGRLGFRIRFRTWLWCVFLVLNRKSFPMCTAAVCRAGYPELPYENILFRLPRRASDLLTSSGSALPERRLLIDQWSGAFWTNDEEDQDKALGERNSKGERGRRQDEGRRPQPHYMPPAEHRRREATAEGNGTGDRKPTNATEETREESPCEKWGAHAEATQADAGAETEVESYRETATKAQACVEATETRTQGPNDRDADPGRVDRRTKNGSRSALLKEAVEQATGEKVSQLLDDAATSHLQSTGMQGRWTRPLVPGKGSASKTQPAEEAVRPAGSVHHVLPDWRQERRKGPHHDIRCENGCQSMQMSSPSFAVSSPVSPPSSLSLSSASRPVARPTTSSASPAFAASSAGSSAPCGSASTPQLLTESDFPSLSPFVSTGRPPAPRGPGLADAEAGPVCSKLFPPGVAPVSPSLSASPCGGHKTEAANAISRLGNQCRREVDRNTKDERPALLNDGSSAECMVGAPCARDGSRGNRTAFWPAPDEVGLSGVGQPGDVTAWQRVETKRGKKQNSTCGREAADTVQRGGEIRNTIPALQQPSSHHSGNAHQSSSCSVPPVGRGFGVAHDARARDGHESSAGMPPRVKSVAASIAEHRQRFNTDGPPSLRQRSGEVETGARGGEQYPPGRGFALRDFLVVPSAGQRKKRKNGKETRPSEEQTTQDERAYNVATHRLGAWSRGSAVAEPLVAESACVQTDASPVADLAAIMREEELLRQERVLRFQLRQSQELAQHPSSVVRLSGPPSVVVVSRPVATAAAQASGSDPGTGAARSRARDGPVGPGAPRPSRADAASFNRWGREAALRLQGEKGFGASDLTVIQREQFAEQEEDLAKRREEEELQVALRLVREMEERERQQEANFQREIRRAAELERRRIDARQGRMRRQPAAPTKHHFRLGCAVKEIIAEAKDPIPAKRQVLGKNTWYMQVPPEHQQWDQWCVQQMPVDSAHECPLAVTLRGCMYYFQHT
ncbi:conserved hypothetical protein [Neospora caninum Liverpool]|uniref:Uncharacterized protein n=1 Tax=Neospora caninum (strain Liverpool) TaxID=572307 RepID=F0VAL1_NEOCL|nr:conserved hypothetical protein [Neospora caninum Liverpool]CBZ50700.1 conserved hypothetical protein [Neospora caninum Liverpool]|eukprot:XP_003880733.1 conserved hypothetical protein [Neospora caninum Liverpool]